MNSNAPRSTRLAGVAIVLLPVACVFFAFRQLDEQQPYFGGRMSDPSYIYLLSSLNLATFSAPGHVDHPGTPVQILGALILRVLHPTLNSEALAATVLAAPEPHAQMISLILLMSAVIASLGAGAWVLRRTNRIDGAIFCQAGPLLVAAIPPGYSGLRPEPLLIACAHFWVAAWIIWSEGALDLYRRTTWLALAALGGFAVACKYTFAPLLLIPLFLLGDFQARAKFLAASVGAFLVCIAPALPQFHRLAAWVFRLAVRDGAYGRGQVGLAPHEGWSHALTVILTGNPRLAFFVGLLGFSTLVAWWQRDTLAALARHRALSSATLLALLAAIMMVAKQSGGADRYLLPAAMCLPLGLYCGWRAHAGRLPPLWRRGVAIGAGVAFTAAGLAIMGTQIKTVRAERTAALEAREWIQKNLSHEIVLPMFGASSAPFALFQADVYANRWDRLLATTYPGFDCVSLWGGGFRHNFSHQPEPPPQQTFYLTGAPLSGGVLDDARQLLPWPIELVWSNGIEAVYRVAPVTDRKT